jgi:tetratricopeptide (TPR) repeat protein
LLEPALAARGTRVAPLLLGASLRFEQERWREALELTDQAEREFEARDDTAALVGLYSTRGKAHARLGEPRLAEEAFLAGIRRVPQDLDCYTHLAYLYALEGRAADAGAILRRLVEVNDSPDGYAAAVRTLRVMGDERSAAAVLRDARRRWPQAGELAELAG